MSVLQSLIRGGWLRSVDGALADSLRRLRPETPDLVLAAAALASRALANGHSQLPLSWIGELLLEGNSDAELPSLPPVAVWMDALRNSPWVGTAASEADASVVLMLDGNAVSLRRYWRYEARLAAAIQRRLSTPTLPLSHAASARINHLFAADDGSLLPAFGAEAQADAARHSLSHRLLLLTGGPGTGKTSTVARALVAFAEQFAAQRDQARPRILLAAPTGKAAARLAESVRDSLAQLVADGRVTGAFAGTLPSQAATLHRLLGWRRGSSRFEHDAERPLPADLVVVDEASMIDLPLMCKLLEAIPDHAGLVLIGDRDQLPSVETGDVLAALCDAADDSSTSLAAHRVHLTHSHRQAVDRDIAALAERIRNGDANAVVAGLGQASFRGVRWQQGGDRALADVVLAQALPAYRAVQAAQDVPAALAAARRFRVLTAVRDGSAGTHALNAVIGSALDPSRRGDGFFPGRLILITENSYRHNLFNGDIGVVWADEGGELRVWFDAEGGPRAWLPAALPGHESAFALTVHKAQGSEFDEVFFALPERGGRVLSRELIYTALTRCRRQATLWAGETVLREAIARKAQRWSGLARRLRDESSVERVELSLAQCDE